MRFFNNALLTLGAGLASLLGLELLVTVYLHPAGGSGALNDNRTWAQVVRDLRREGHQAYPIADFQFLWRPADDGTLRSPIAIGGTEVLPLAPRGNVTTVSCNESGDWIVYRSDHLGFRDPPSAWQQPHVDVALVGDSFVHGHCVGDDEDIAANIRRSYLATLNFGRGGFGPLGYLAVFREYVAPLTPRHVLIGYYEGNDLANLTQERRSKTLPGYLESGYAQEPLHAHRAEVDRQLQSLLDSAVKGKLDADSASAALRFAKLSNLRLTVDRLLRANFGSAKAGTISAGHVALLEVVLTIFKRETEAWHGHAYFVYVPAMHRIDPEYRSQDSGAGWREEVLAAVARVGIPLIDLVPAIERQREPQRLLPRRRDELEQAHYGPAGYRLLADEILRALKAAPLRD
jgi:hypothetical protein